MKSYKIISLFLLISVSYRPGLFAQYQSKLVDGRTSDPFCMNYHLLILEKPKEVLFGFDITDNGDVYFHMTNEGWFKKLFTPGMAVTADIVARDRYSCTNYHPGTGPFKGYVLTPVRQEDFGKNMTQLMSGSISIKIGKVPPELRKKEIEANLVILYHDKVCYYTDFFDIDRSGWDLLPMGLYTDALLTLSPHSDTAMDKGFTYTQMARIVVPFARNKDSYERKDVEKIYDSLHLKNCVIRRVSIRAYSSVEGTEAVNRQLMKGRANSMVSVLKKV